MNAPKAFNPTDLTWKRENSAWVARTPEGKYQIEGRSNNYAVWYYADNPYGKQPNTMLATGQYYLDYAKQTAEEDHAKRTAVAAYTSGAFKKIAAAQEQLRLAWVAARRDGLEEAENVLRAAYDQLDVTRQAVLCAGKVSEHDPREVSA